MCTCQIVLRQNKTGEGQFVSCTRVIDREGVGIGGTRRTKRECLAGAVHRDSAGASIGHGSVYEAQVIAATEGETTIDVDCIGRAQSYRCTAAVIDGGACADGKGTCANR